MSSASSHHLGHAKPTQIDVPCAVRRAARASRYVSYPHPGCRTGMELPDEGLVRGYTTKGRRWQGALEEAPKKTEAVLTVPRCLTTAKDKHPARVVLHEVPSPNGDAWGMEV